MGTTRRTLAYLAAGFLAAWGIHAAFARAPAEGRVHAAHVPDDFLYGLQWSLQDEQGIRVPRAWDVSTGSGVRVAVLSTGVVSNPQLNANVVAGYDFVSDATNARDGNGRDADPTDPGDHAAAGECGVGTASRGDSWRGTEIAGVIAAVADFDDIIGAAYGAKVVPVRVLGKCGGTVADIADAIRWSSGATVAGVPAIASPVEVIALGMNGSGACAPALQSAIDAAVAAGVVVVAGAGDGNGDAGQYYPGNCANVVNVAGISRLGFRAPYSNFGPAVDVAAPGGSTGYFGWEYGYGVYATTNGTTTERFGTAMAMANVAGVAALMQAAKANTPADVAAILGNTTHPLPLPCPENCGTGMVDAALAVRAAQKRTLFVSAPEPANEGNAGTHAIEFQVRLSQPLDVPLTFDVATANGTALAGTDYVAKSLAAQVIPAGETAYAFSVLVRGDTLAEQDEAFSVGVSNVSGAAVDTIGASVRILTDECPVLENGVPLANLAGTTACFQVTVPAYASNLVISAGGSGVGLYTRANELPDLRGGYWLWDCSTSPCRVFGTFSQPATYYAVLRGYPEFSGASITASYTPPATPQLSVADVSVLEGDGGTRNLDFTVQLSSSQHAGVSFDVATTDLGATAGSDYTAFLPTAITIAPGQASRVVHVPIAGDVDIEGDEAFAFDLLDVAGADVVDGHAVGTIRNDDGPLLSVGDVNIGEGNSGTKLATFTVSLNQPSTGAETFDIATRDGNATAGSDYTALSLKGQTIPAGQLARTYSVTIVGDTALEPNELIHLDLRATSGASAIDGDGYIQILNDEGPTLSVLDASLREGDNYGLLMTIPVRLSRASSGTVTYEITSLPGTADSDDAYLGTTRGSIPAGSLTGQVTVYLKGDQAIEPDETIGLYLHDVVNATAFDWRGVGTILNDDGPSIKVRNVVVTEGDAGTRLATFEVRLSQAMPNPVTYSIATVDNSALAGSDYVARTLVGEVIPAGMLSRTFTVEVNGDTLDEGTEVFGARLFDVQGGVGSWSPPGTGYILNDDGPALSVLDASVVEGDSGTRAMNVTLKLSKPSTQRVMFSLGAYADSAGYDDFQFTTFSGLTIAAGATSRTVVIPVNGDTTHEGNETIRLLLTDVSGATRYDWQGVGTIVNDDGPTLSVQNTGITEGDYGTKVATFLVTLSQATTVPVIFDIATSDGTATAGSDYVAKALPGYRVPAGMLSRTFEVVINGDLAVEGNETFKVTVANASGATIFRPQATGTIADND